MVRFKITEGFKSSFGDRPVWYLSTIICLYFCHFFDSCRKSQMNLNELIMFRQMPGVPDVNLESKSLVSAPCKTCLLGRSYTRRSEASCTELMERHLLEELFPDASVFVCLFPSIKHTDELFASPWDPIREGCCLHSALRKRPLLGLKACPSILLSFDYGNLKSVRYLPCLCSNGNLIYSLVCQI